MKPKYNKIMFCSDFSTGADQAFPTAVDLADRYGARLFLVHIIPESDRYLNETEALPGRDSTGGKDDLEAAVQKLEDRYLHRLGGYAEVETKVLRGVPIVEIVRFARDREVDLIVMGAAGSSARNKLHFGSTAENVARRAPCAVMCIRSFRK